MNGVQWNGQANLYSVPASDATALYVGDLVKMLTGGDANGVPQVTKALAADNGATGSVVVGAIVGFVVDPTNLNTPQFRAASTLRYMWVSDDPRILYEVGDNGTAGVNAVGKNANIVATNAGSTTTGASGMELDASTVATTAGLVLRIVQFAPRVDNDPTSANARILVHINKHTYADDAAGVAGV
jgi:hypothetical protein